MIVQSAESKHATECGVRDRRDERPAAGGEHQVVVGHADFTREEGFRFAVDAGDPLPGMESDVVFLVLGERVQEDFLRVLGAVEHEITLRHDTCDEQWIRIVPSF